MGLWSNELAWISAVLGVRSCFSRKRLEGSRSLMNAPARNALVTDFEDLIGILLLPDPNNRSGYSPLYL